MPRREFTKATKVEIVKRATHQIDGRSVVVCEGCGLVDPRVWHIDHTNPDALQVDKSKPLTAADGKLLCAGSRESCHGTKTAEEDVPRIAKAKRNEAKHLGLRSRGPLAGADREERHARANARSADRRSGKLDVPPRRSLFV